jgi:TolB protein
MTAKLYLLLLILLTTSLATHAVAQTPAPPANEAVLGVVPVVDDGKDGVRPIKLAILPSLAPDLEDVIVRSVVRRDLELTGLFDVIEDAKAPSGLYGFDDPVDIDAWRKLGAEVIVKVAAKLDNKDKAKIFGLCYFPTSAKIPSTRRASSYRSRMCV